MAATRNTDFTLIDYSEEINLVPRVHSLVSDMGLFEVSYISTTVAQIERVTEISELFSDRARNGERNWIGSESAVTQNLNLPFFPMDKAIQASDYQNFRKYGTGDTSKTVQDGVIRAMARIRRSHSQLQEKAFVTALYGASYSPSGLASYDYYDLWGLTQATADVDFSSGEDAAAIIESEARAHIIEEAQDGAGSYELMALCGTEWFSAFIASDDVEESYKYYSSSQELLRERQGGSANGRRFVHKDVTYLEDISGNVGSAEALIFPKGIPNMFKVYYGPANDLDYVNKDGQELYLWYKEDKFNRQAKIESETSMLAVCTRPELVVLSTATID